MYPLSLRFAPDVIAARTQGIAHDALSQSQSLAGPNFTRIAPGDLSRLFDLYDQAFFGGFLRRTLADCARGRMTFRLAPRMTRAGGKTFRIGRNGDARYEIAVSSRLLFLNFDDSARPATVCGLPCADRLSALQRIMEHEMLHLTELLLWDRSSCAAARFKQMSRDIFGHGASTHDLVTPTERAMTKYDLRPGDEVSFELDGRAMRGMLNRVNRRATVLVESVRGRRYTNGKRYEKFYVPLGMLRKAM
jgi:hypothetical protein